MDIFFKDKNTIEDLLNAFQIEVYSKDTPVGTLLLENALNKKLEEDPNYEVWVQYRCWVYLKGGRNKGALFFKDPNVYISNKGNAVDLLNPTEPLVQKGTSDGYTQISFKRDEVVETNPTHRIISSVFITPKGDNVTTPLTKLQVNHKDGVKFNNDYCNLEWVTISENIKHAWEAGLMNNFPRNFLLGCLYGKRSNLKFIMGVDEGRQFFNLGRVNYVGSSNYKTPTPDVIYYFPNEKDLVSYRHVDELSDEERTQIKIASDNGLYSNVLMGTVVADGKYQGRSFLLTPGAEAKSFGLSKAIDRAKKGEGVCKGCVFKFASLEEIGNTSKLSEVSKGMREFILGYSSSATLIGVIDKPNKYHGVRFLIDTGKEAWDYGLHNAFRVAKKVPGYSHSKGCSFEIATKHSSKGLPRLSELPIEIQTSVRSHGGVRREYEALVGKVFEEGKFKGVEFLLLNGTAKRFNLQRAEACAKGTRNHTRGCIFRYAVEGDNLIYKPLTELSKELQLHISSHKASKRFHVKQN